MELKGKVAIVTGGASGIGRALAKRFAAEGAEAVVVADINGDLAKAVARTFEGTGLGLGVDVTREEQVQELVATTEAEFGRIDLMCSNAGIIRRDGAPWGATSGSNADWMASFKVNVMGHLYGARAALPGMLARKAGYFLHTASAAGLLSQIGSASYAATKHAAIGFAESLAIAHGDQGIGVSVLCPQAVRTPMLGDEPGAASVDGVMDPQDLAEATIEGLRAERFLILPHPEVRTYMDRKASDYDRWLSGMRKLRARIGLR